MVDKNQLGIQNCIVHLSCRLKVTEHIVILKDTIIKPQQTGVA